VNYDSIFFINHALKVNSLSVYSNEERFEQTLETISSIDNYCPNNIKFVFDSSVEMPDENYVKELTDRGVNFYYMGNIPSVRGFSKLGQYGTRSIAECISFIHFLDNFKQLNIKAKRIYKLSGRYRLSDNFILEDNRFADAFVFSEALESWLTPIKKTEYNIDKLYRLRLWHMDYSLLDSFTLLLPKILQDCATYGIDVEHSYYKNLHTYKTIELDKIGVCGNTAPDGAYIDE